MVSIRQSSWVFSLNSINGVSSFKTPLLHLTKPISRSFKVLKLSASFKESSEAESPSIKPPLKDEEPSISDPVKLAFAKAKAYKKSKPLNPIPTPDPVSESIEIEKKNDELGTYKKSKSLNPIPTADSVSESIEIAKKNVPEEQKDSGLQEMKVNMQNLKDGVVEKNASKKEELTISRIDFLGFDFSEKKSRGVPAGLIPVSDPFPEGDLPKVEFIAGDTSKFEAETLPKPNLSTADDDGSDLYKPKVSTWGVFPRPSNISKTFGGGRVIRPGEVLEASEDKAAKEARTRELLAAYRNRRGLNIDPKTKADCEKALKDGDHLMDLGKLQQALPYYEKVMKDLVFQGAGRDGRDTDLTFGFYTQWLLYGLEPAFSRLTAQAFLECRYKKTKDLGIALMYIFVSHERKSVIVFLNRMQSELHGLAALQWSICQDSLTRSNEAQVMYEKLQSHPNVQVSKKARQFVFSFQAMEMMKIKNSSGAPKSTGYQNYFEAFIEDKANYNLTEEENQDALREALPYIIFLFSPIFLVLYIAVKKGI